MVGGGRCPIINISGGTEVGACFLSPLPITELKPCTLRGPALGMDVDVFGPDGTAVGPGEVGELVCKQPWPGDDPRHLKATPSGTSRRTGAGGPDVWTHGDWASIDEDGFWFLHGRSDDTLKIAGKRLGPGRGRERARRIRRWRRAAAVGIPHEVKGETIWCFVVTTPGAEPADALRPSSPASSAEHLGKAFRPEPRSLRRRTAEDPQRQDRAPGDPRHGRGRDPGDLSSLENPSALDAIQRLPRHRPRSDVRPCLPQQHPLARPREA